MIEPQNLEPYVKAFFTDKAVGIDKTTVLQLGNKDSKIYMPIQKHTNTVNIITDMTPAVADSVITQRSDIGLGVQVADCVPILLYDKKNGTMAAVHAGWRGTATGILINTINTFYDTFKSHPQDILIAIGPSIKGCCYEVGEEVVEAINQINSISCNDAGSCHTKNNGKWHTDLASVNVLQAKSLGIDTSNIWISNDCTYHMPERYYSYRKQNGHKGRQGAFIFKR